MASRQGGPGAGNAPGSDTNGTVGEPETTLDPLFEPAELAAPTQSRSAEDPPLRDPGLYALTDHFLQRLGHPGRYVSIANVSETIRRGQLRWNTTDGWRFAAVEDGVRFVVVVGDTDTNSPVVVTAWTEIADRDEAIASSRWDETDVDTIQLRSDLSDHADERIPDRIRPRTVTRPFRVGHHLVRTAPGHGYVTCGDCGGRFQSKAELTTRRCR